MQYIVQKRLNFKMISAMKLPILSLINSRLEVFLAVENILVMVTALVGNALMCVSVVRLLRKQLPSNLFILSLVSPKLIALQYMVLFSLNKVRLFALGKGHKFNFKLNHCFCLVKIGDPFLAIVIPYSIVHLVGGQGT